MKKRVKELVSRSKYFLVIVPEGWGNEYFQGDSFEKVLVESGFCDSYDDFYNHDLNLDDNGIVDSDDVLFVMGFISLLPKEKSWTVARPKANIGRRLLVHQS